MISDLLEMPDQTIFRTGICIVGAGAAGIALAREFLGSRTQVLLVESGGRNPEDEIEALHRGEAVGVAHGGLDEGQRRGLGGTTQVWSAQCIRMDRVDFGERSWVPHSGWPFLVTEFDAYYRRAEAMFGLTPGTFDRHPWTMLGVPPLKLDPAKLGASFSAYSPRPHRYPGRAWGERLRRSTNVNVLLHATAARVDTNESGQVAESLELRTIIGKTATVHATAFALCCGGIENARLLLLSNATETGGLGNRYGLVGRFFQDHPATTCATIRTSRPRVLQDRYSALRRDGVWYYPKIPLSETAQTAASVLNCTTHVLFDFGEDSGEEALLRIYASLRGGMWPRAFRRDFARVIGHRREVAGLVERYLRGRSSFASAPAIRLVSLSEQAPNPDSRVSLSTARDALGLPRARLDWRLTELDRRTIEMMARTVGTEFARLGIARTDTPDWLDPEGSTAWTSHVQASFHHSGTTRMAADPTRGVVDRNCKVHPTANLFVCGSSVFPTSGTANPTLTIVALAIRLADHLKSSLATG